VQQLVEQNHVQAFLQMSDPIGGQASESYLTSHNIPVIGSESGSAWFYQSPMFFPQVPSGDILLKALLGSLATQARAQGQIKLGTINCIEVPLCSRLYTVGPVFAPSVGLNLVYRGQASLVTPDFTSECQAAQGAGVQLLFVMLDSNSFQRVGRSCATVNYHPILATGTSIATPSMATDSHLEGALIGMNFVPWTLNTPSLSEYRSALKQFAPNLPIAPITLVGWISAKLFQTAAQHLTEPPTSASLLAGLWSLKGDDLGGLTIPLTFTQGQNAPQTLCWWSVEQIKNGQYATPYGGQRTCP
jgi:branched-chain amino acid transport system substrate-binding protein